MGVYGTLKQGQYNNNPNWPLVGRGRIEGVMQTNGFFPRLFQPADVPDGWPVREFPLEILDVPDEQFHSVQHMEERAGYYLATLPQYDCVVFWAIPETFNPERGAIREWPIRE
jgi:gamma-glutamylcyclotransferase (GGCT)/AIG2-like uncharacterized protein YtfP